MGACLARAAPCPRRRPHADETIPLLQHTQHATLPNGMGIVYEERDGTKIFYGPRGATVVTKDQAGQWYAAPPQRNPASLRQSPVLPRKGPSPAPPYAALL